jgi:uncharacterized membrane protein
MADRARAGWRWLEPGSWLTLALLLASGLAICAVTPPFQAPDEQSHLLRAAAIADGRFVTRLHPQGAGEFVPRGMFDLIPILMPRMARNPGERFRADEFRRAAAVPFRGGERVFVPYLSGYTAGLLPPTGHLPAAGGIVVARLARLNALTAFYAARLGTMAVSVLLVWGAVRLTPVARWPLLLFAFLPMTLFIRSVVSTDGVALGLASLLVAIVLRAAVGGGEVSRGDISGIAVVSFLLVTAKPTYVLLAALAVGVPVRRWGSHARAAAALLLIAAGTVAGVWSVLWWARPQHIAAAAASAGAPGMEVPGLSIVARAPGEVIAHIAKSYWSAAPHYLEQFAGRLGWLDAPVPYTIRALLLLGLLVSLFAAGSTSATIPLQLRLLGLVAFAAAAFLTALAFYDPATGLVAGVQGRYLIPPAVALVCTFANPLLSVRYRVSALDTLFGAIALTGVAGALYALVVRYHG